MHWYSSGFLLTALLMDWMLRDDLKMQLLGVDGGMSIGKGTCGGNMCVSVEATFFTEIKVCNFITEVNS